MSENAFTRRTLLVGGGVAVLTAILGTTVSCSAGNPVGPGASSSAPLALGALPDYIPLTLVEPDVPGTPEVMAGYYQYPTSRKRLYAKPPLKGLGAVSIVYPSYAPVPPGPPSNTFWSQLESDLGVELTIQPVPAADYPSKFQTLVASGSLPDIMVFPTPTPDQPRLMKSMFADLGPYLSGKKSADYPNLANIPTAAWLGALANGSLYAVPQQRAQSGQALFYRKDRLDELGHTKVAPADFAELQELFEEVTDEKKQRWALSKPNFIDLLIRGMMGAPNNWAVKDGVFTHAWQDKRTREAIARTAEIVASGVVHPSAATASATSHRDFFANGQTAFLIDGFAAWDVLVRMLGGGKDGVAKLRMLVTPGYDGGADGPHLAGRSFQALTVIKGGLDEERTKGLLRLLDFLAAPIGSEEHLRRKFGKADVDYTIVDGKPELTTQGTTNYLDLQYIVDAPTILGPGAQAGIDIQHEWHSRTAPKLIKDPTEGLYSETATSRMATISRPVLDVIEGVYFGRNSLEDFDKEVERWLAAGGSQMADEYAKSAEAE